MGTAGRIPRADEAAGRGARSTYAQMLPTKKTSTSVETMPMIRYAGFDSESAMASGTHEGALEGLRMMMLLFVPT